MTQYDLSGKPISITTGTERRLIKVSSHTNEMLNRARAVKPLNKIEITEIGTKLAVMILNKMSKDDAVHILTTNDLSQIEETVSKLFIKNQ